MTSTNNEFPAPEVQQLMEEQKFYAGDPEEDSLRFQNTAKNTGGQNVLVDIIKQLKPGVELYKIAMPSYVLQPISLLEKLSIYSTPSNVLSSPKQFSTNAKENKMIVLVGWLLSTWRSVPRNGIEEVKPYNPVLGEYFFCKWIHDPNDHSELCAEQISHHPPISAVYMRNKKRNFVYKGWVYPKVSFSLNSFTTITDGKFSVDWEGDSYTFKYPNVVASGVLLGSTVIRASESLTVTNKDYIAKIKFDKDSVVVGHIYNAKKEKVYSLKGNFTKSVHITHLPTQTKHELYDVSKIIKPPRVVKPVFQQAEYESQRNWHKVTVNVKKQDFEEANKAKFVIEERERKLAAARKEKGTPHVPKLFKKEGDDWVFIGESALEQEAATIPLNPTTPVTNHTSS